MVEWKVSISEELTQELEDCFAMGPIINDQGLRYIPEEQFARLNGLKIEVFSDEHPPPHFRVCYQGACNNFKISDCTPLNGSALSTYFRNIKKWHAKNKAKLIEFWNSKRPSDCPVGNYMEN